MPLDDATTPVSAVMLLMAAAMAESLVLPAKKLRAGGTGDLQRDRRGGKALFAEESVTVPCVALLVTWTTTASALPLKLAALTYR